ncbi:hypothetical protein BHYA_0030g00490 [Botrytis hyacinthi]|uniref:Uncharacterized protein n=1 Tax=Botrytis hyacinthi TaxID=278943 RepID=A0A4Z1GZS9_9HELO|nr:hypothetical protein BHYA_0030g00490 [Botrytis hyacinthi]
MGMQPGDRIYTSKCDRSRKAQSLELSPEAPATSRFSAFWLWNLSTSLVQSLALLVAGLRSPERLSYL